VYNKTKGGDGMGMTDRQFDAHNKTLLRLYEKIRIEVREKCGDVEIENLETLIKDTEDLLNRP